MQWQREWSVSKVVLKVHGLGGPDGRVVRGEPQGPCAGINSHMPLTPFTAILHPDFSWSANTGSLSPVGLPC